MEFQELFKLLIRKKFYLIFIPVISGMIAFSFRYTSAKMYFSESQIATGLTLTIDFTGESSKVNPFEMSLSFSNLTENMASKTVVNRLGYKLLFHDLSIGKPFRNPEFIELPKPEGELLDTVLIELKSAINEFGLVSKTEGTGRYINNLMKEYEYHEVNFLDNGFINRVGNTDFINIGFTSEVPELSAYVVNEWGQGFIEYYNFQKYNSLNESLGVLTQILSEKQRLLDESTQKLNRYKSRFIFLNSDGDSDPVGEMEKLIREKESEIRNLNFRLTDVRDKIAGQDKSSSFNSRKRIVKLKNELDRMSTLLLEDVQNQVFLDSVQYYRNELQTEMYLHTSSNSDKSELDDLFEKESELGIKYKLALVDKQKLRDQYQIEKGTIRNLASTKSNVENLEKEVEQSRKEFLNAQDRYQQARSRLLIGSNNLKMSYYGDVPEESKSRMTIIFTAIGGVAGFVITVFLIIGLELIDSRIKNPIKFERSTKLEPNGILPYLSNIEGDLSKVLVGKFPGVDKEVGSSFLQTLRKIRFDIQRSFGKVFLFTSLREGSGKSFLLTSLAFSLSLIKKNVLIIDTNFRNNRLSNSLSSKSLDTDKLSGLNVILTNNDISKYEASKNMKSDFLENGVFTKTSNPYVYLMKSQNIQQSPEEIFSRVDFDRFISMFKNEFDYIFIEGAALNVFSDTKELSVYAEYLIPVFSVEDEFVNMDKKSMQFLNENKGKLILKLLNKVRLEDAE